MSDYLEKMAEEWDVFLELVNSFTPEQRVLWIRSRGVPDEYVDAHVATMARARNEPPPAARPARPAPVLALVRPAGPGLEQLVDGWLTFLAAKGRAPRTRDEYRYTFTKAMADIGCTDPAALTEEDLAGYLEARAGQPAWSKQVLKAVRSFYSWARRRGHVPDNPAEHLSPPRQPEPDPDALTEEEFIRVCIAAAAVNPRRAWALILLLETGARIGSLAGVLPEDVRPDGQPVLFFRVAKNSRPYRVPLSPLAAIAADELLALARPGGSLIGVKPTALWGWYHVAAVRVGLPVRKQRPHVLRDTFATNHVERGTPHDVIRRLLNHSDTATLIKRYVLTRDSRIRESMTTSSFSPNL